jgi:uncharacterized membrane protein YgdD (TMEM256/DUF423 family)
MPTLFVVLCAITAIFCVDLILGQNAENFRGNLFSNGFILFVGDLIASLPF